MIRALWTVVLLLVALPAYAAGVLLPRDGGEPVAVESHRVHAVVTDGIARTVVRQTFVNRAARVLEAVYLFPLPEGAALTHVAMEVDGQRLEGLLAGRKQARRVYDEIVSGRRDPALVEQIGRDLFRLSVFPVAPEKPTVVELTYLQPLPLSESEIRYVYPLSLGGGATTVLSDLSVDVTLRSSVPISEVLADSEHAEISRFGPREARVTLRLARAALDRDLTVIGTVEAPKANLAVRTWRPERGDGYFTAILTPPGIGADEPLPRDVVIVLDASASMAGDGKIEQAKAAARHVLAGLGPSDRANLIRFGAGVERFAASPVSATKRILAALRIFVAETAAAGGTALDEALTEALATARVPGRVTTVVLLSDGKPTVGATAPLLLVGRAKERGPRVYTFGIGPDVRAGLLRGFAKATGGHAEVFPPGAPVEGRMTVHRNQSGAPALTGVRIAARGVELKEFYPRPVPIAGAGEQLVICGRYAGSGDARVIVTAKFGDTPVELTETVDFPVEPGGDRAVRDLFARLKLDFLEEELLLRSGLTEREFHAALDRGDYSEKDDAIEEIAAVSLTYGIQSAVTGFLVLLPEDRDRIDPRDEVAIEAALERSRRRNRPVTVPEIGPYHIFEPVIRDAKPGAVRRHVLTRTLDTFAVAQALRWLAGAQRDDGSFEGSASNTALALLAFLGEGSTYKYGAYRATIKRALMWAKKQQRPDGSFPEDGDLLTLALVEVYALTGSPIFKHSAQMGVDHLAASGTMTAWSIGALTQARRAGLRVPKKAIARAKEWAAERTNDSAKALFARVFLTDEHHKNEELLKASERFLRSLPAWTETKTPDLRHVWFGTVAMFHMRGERWNRWAQALEKALVGNQVMGQGDLVGSWPPTGSLDRVGATAHACLSLEIYYRYARVFGASK